MKYIRVFVLLFLIAPASARDFSKHIETSIIIKATPDAIWSALTDLSAHAKWNPFIQSISGSLEEGGKLSVTVKSPGKDPMEFEPDILVVKANQELRWKGKFLITGLFDGEHYFILEPQNDGTTKFIHGEHFSGLMVYVFYDDLDLTQQGFELMNTALKLKVEA